MANPIISIMILITIRMNREISFPAFDRSQMVLAQRFSGTMARRAAEAVIIRNPAKALTEPTDNIVSVLRQYLESLIDRLGHSALPNEAQTLVGF